MTDLRLVHASGCARATDDEWLAALNYWTADADVVVLTEAGGVGTILLAWCRLHDWDLAHAVAGRGRGEAAILVRKGFGRISKRRVKRLTRLHLHTARKAPLHAVKAFVEPYAGGSVWVTGTHLPAHVEGPGGLRPGWASRVYRAAALGWSELRYTRSPNRIISADWNLNHRRRWVRAYLRTLFPGTKPGWDFDNLPERGTLRGSLRLIDGPRSNLEVAEHTKILGSMPGFDHLATRTVYRLED